MELSSYFEINHLDWSTLFFKIVKYIYIFISPADILNTDSKLIFDINIGSLFL